MSPCADTRLSRRFLLNPYEVAFIGPPNSSRTGFVDAVQAGLHGRLRLGRALLDAEPEPESVRAHTTCVQRGAVRHLSYDAAADDYVRQAVWLECDAVLIESSREVAAPTVLFVGDEAPATEPETVLAYVGRGLFRPATRQERPYFSFDQSAALAQFLLAHFEQQAAAVPLLGLVLAGGKSTRMRRDKAALVYRDRAQVEVVYELLGRYCGEAFVSMRAEQPQLGGQPLPAITDAFLGFGPMGGILSALKARPDAAWLVLACDLPYLEPEALEGLVAARNPFRMATAYRNGRDGWPEPLCAIYEPKSIVRLLEFLGFGWHCPRKVLLNSATHLVDALNPRWLENVNEPAEYETALAELRAPRNGRTS